MLNPLLLLKNNFTIKAKTLSKAKKANFAYAIWVLRAIIDQLSTQGWEYKKGFDVQNKPAEALADAVNFCEILFCCNALYQIDPLPPSTP